MLTKLAVSAVLIFVALPLIGAARRDQENQLKQALLNRTLVIRNFYAAPNLVFDSTGNLVSADKSVNFAVASIELDKVTLKKDEISVEGKRVKATLDTRTNEMQQTLDDRKTKIEIRLAE